MTAGERRFWHDSLRRGEARLPCDDGLFGPLRRPPEAAARGGDDGHHTAASGTNARGNGPNALALRLGEVLVFASVRPWAWTRPSPSPDRQGHGNPNDSRAPRDSGRFIPIALGAIETPRSPAIVYSEDGEPVDEAVARCVAVVKGEVGTMGGERVTTVGPGGDIVVLEFAPEPRTPEEHAQQEASYRRFVDALANLVLADLERHPPANDAPASAGDDEPVATAGGDLAGVEFVLGCRR